MFMITSKIYPFQFVILLFKNFLYHIIELDDKNIINQSSKILAAIDVFEKNGWDSRDLKIKNITLLHRDRIQPIEGFFSIRLK